MLTVGHIKLSQSIDHILLCSVMLRSITRNPTNRCSGQVYQEEDFIIDHVMLYSISRYGTLTDINILLSNLWLWFWSCAIAVGLSGGLMYCWLIMLCHIQYQVDITFDIVHDITEHNIVKVHPRLWFRFCVDAVGVIIRRIC